MYLLIIAADFNNFTTFQISDYFVFVLSARVIFLIRETKWLYIIVIIITEMIILLYLHYVLPFLLKLFPKFINGTYYFVFLLFFIFQL